MIKSFAAEAARITPARRREILGESLDSPEVSLPGSDATGTSLRSKLIFNGLLGLAAPRSPVVIRLQAGPDTHV